MIWVIDGYNVMHKIPELERALEKNLEAGRHALIGLCERLQGRRGDFQKIYIVFDGNSAFRDLPAYRTAGIEVIFTETREDADDRIIELLETRFESKRVGIISDDNYVINHARVYRAKRMSVADFYDLARAKPTAEASSKSQTSTKRLSAKDARNITDEYRDYLGIK